jgi:secretion/DNA translocation related TadE-like protein
VPEQRPALGIRRLSLDDRGSVSVVMFGVVSAVLIMTVSGLLLASAVVASHRARAAADLAALAAAGVLMRGEPVNEACQFATQVAAANHGRMTVCIASGMEVRLTVAVPAALRGVGIATARSRAGPDPKAG